jgi:polyisoprenoid-binding protein YceI
MSRHERHHEPEDESMTQLMTEQGMVRVPAGTWKVDPAHSSAAFAVKHMMIATVRGQFREFDGTLEAAEDDPANSRVQGSAKAASIDTGNDERDAHLRSADFFDAERYPDITFASTRIEHVEGGTYRVTGDLTIKDVTREVQMTATVEGAGQDPWGNERVGVAVRGTIDRTQFGLTWQQKVAGGGLLVGEKVQVLLDVSAVRTE